MSDYPELIKELREPCPHENCVLCQKAADAIEKLQAYADLYRDGGETAMRMVEQYKTAYIAEHDARIEETKRNCPHYIRNVHDRGDASLCDKYKCEVNALPKWIPVTERLPNENDDVLIYGEWTGASGTKYREIWLTDLKEFLHQGYKPIVWMPLTQPPKEDEA